MTFPNVKSRKKVDVSSKKINFDAFNFLLFYTRNEAWQIPQTIYSTYTM